MIEELTDLPAGVIGVEISGKIETRDYDDVLNPVVERAAESGGVRNALDQRVDAATWAAG